MFSTGDLWEDVQDHIGADLRAVIEYEALDYEHSLREDIEEQYTESEIKRTVSESIIMQLGINDRPSGLKTGELNAIMRVYEGALILSYPHPRKRKAGVLISIDQPRETATLADVEQCMQLLEERVSAESE